MAGKRVRFSYEEPEEDDDEDNSRPRKLRFPKGRKEARSSTTVVDLPEEDDLLDARVAANERALRRNTVDLRSAEDAANIGDILDAEEETEENEERLEPFNLDAERSEGYFDDDGHYVEYAAKLEARDAWLDGAVVDTRFANQLEERDEGETPAISPEEIGQMKKRIAELLEPGETVLEALRRVKGTSNNRGTRRLTGDAKVAFDQLTENAMKLMDAGESDVYEKVREAFQREADAVLTKTKSANIDMFGDDDEEASEPPASNTVDNTKPAAPEDKENDSGYVYDNSSGYYYNAGTGYYYDPGSGLYGNASSGQWFKFDEENNMYVEAV